MLLKALVRVHVPACLALGPGAGAAQLTGARHAGTFTLHARDEASLERALAAWLDLAGGDARVLGRSDRSLLLEGANPLRDAFAVLEQHRCAILWPVRLEAGVATFHLLAPSRAAVQAVVAGLARVGRAEVETVAGLDVATLDVALPVTGVTRALTRRQLDVLVRAVETGFYDTPRRASVESLAADLGISPSTCSEHLRKAERAALAQFVGLVRLYPLLAREDLKRPGRPPRQRAASPPPPPA